MSQRIKDVTVEMEKISDDVRATFAHFSGEQLNRKPSEKGWSVGQCFEHLIKTNTLFYPEFDKLAAGTRQNSFWENWSPFTGWAGRFLINAVSIDSKKAKAPSKRVVPPSEIEPDIIVRFLSHQDDVIGKIKACENVEAQKTVVTSPFLAVFTYTLDDAYTVLVEHNKRHVRQAKRVKEAEGFPV